MFIVIRIFDRGYRTSLGSASLHVLMQVIFEVFWLIFISLISFMRHSLIYVSAKFCQFLPIYVKTFTALWSDL